MSLPETSMKNAEPIHESPDPQHLRHAGFTLIEIMAVVVIMGMLMATLAVAVGSWLGRIKKNK